MDPWFRHQLESLLVQMDGLKADNGSLSGSHLELRNSDGKFTTPVMLFLSNNI
jgi:hypothetical protein